MTAMTRRDFLLGFRFGKSGLLQAEEAEPVPGPVPEQAERSLPPEFSPALLRAEAARLGLQVAALTEKELSIAVMRAMYAQCPQGPQAK